MAIVMGGIVSPKTSYIKIPNPSNSEYKVFKGMIKLK